MAEAFIVRRGGGGGSGATLVVTSAGAGTVTVSNSTLGKSYSKSVTAGGSVTFKGLKTGEWTVTVSNGTQTATRSVTINADYSVSVAYFSATISVTYPATSTCVVTNSGGQTVASDTNIGTSAKTWTATVGATGTYTVTATATDGSGKSKSTTVSITADGQSKSVTLSYELVLFDNGTDNATATGGWGFSGSSGGGSIKSNNLYVYGQSGNDYTDGIGYMYTKSKVDLTNYRAMNFTVSSCSDTAGGRAFGVSTSQSSDKNLTASSGISVATKSVDISSLTGSYYIKGYQVGWTSLGYFNVSKVWLT